MTTMIAPAWQPCPFCAAELLPDIDGMEHPDSDTCPLDSLWLRNNHREAWNSRAQPDARDNQARVAALTAAIAACVKYRHDEKTSEDAALGAMECALLISDLRDQLAIAPSVNVQQVRLQDLRPIWKAHGGEWNGPRVERWSIPESNMTAFFTAALRSIARHEDER